MNIKVFESQISLQGTAIGLHCLVSRLLFFFDLLCFYFLLWFLFETRSYYISRLALSYLCKSDWPHASCLCLLSVENIGV